MTNSSTENLMFTKTHEWLKDLGGGRYAVGITDYAQNELGNLVYAGLPAVGDTVIEPYDRVAIFALPETIQEIDRFFK